MLAINNVSKFYGKVKALINFNEELGNGIYALLGPNGSGKSTLMNIIVDILKPDSGNVILDGEDTVKMGTRFRASLGYMPQNPGLYPSFSVISFMRYMAVLKDIPKKDREQQIKEILNEVELYDDRKRRISTLSGGMKQRLALACAVLGNPRLIILDEPTAGLDPRQRINIKNYISRIAINKTIIIATHLVQDIEYIASRVIILKKGVKIESLPPAELLKKIESKVWNTETTEENIAFFREHFKLTAIQNSGNGVILRIIADSRPSENAINVHPSLEDYYFNEFGALPQEGENK